MTTSKTYDNFVSGEWVAGASSAPDINPSDVSDVVGVYAQADVAQVNAAVDAARAGIPAVESVGHATARRCARPHRHRDAGAPRRTRPPARARRRQSCPKRSAKSRAPATSSSSSPASALRLGGEMLPSVRPGVGVEITREPIGVVGLITPWNFPIAIPAWKIAPALAYGNCVVIKPAELVPGCAWALAEIISRSGLPQGRVQSRDGPRQRGRRGAARHRARSTPSASPARWPPASESRRPAVARMARRSSSRWAARTRWSMLDDADLGDRGQRARCKARSSRPASAARRRVALIVTEGIHDRFVAGAHASAPADAARRRRAATPAPRSVRSVDRVRSSNRI